MTDLEVSPSEFKLSKNCLVLEAPQGGKVYLIGTAHFSHESQKEVAELIKEIQPNRVVLELCNSRVNILKYDEETLKKEYKEMDNAKIIQLIRDVSASNKFNLGYYAMYLWGIISSCTNFIV